VHTWKDNMGCLLLATILWLSSDACISILDASDQKSTSERISGPAKEAGRVLWTAIGDQAGKRIEDRLLGQLRIKDELETSLLSTVLRHTTPSVK